MSASASGYRLSRTMRDQRCLPEASIMPIPQGADIPDHRIAEVDARRSMLASVARDGHVRTRPAATFADDAESAALAAKVRQLANELHEIYDHSPCGFHSIDSAGLIVRINDTELEWLGYTRDEVVGRMPFT